jgi:hypothetical protein
VVEALEAEAWSLALPQSSTAPRHAPPFNVMTENDHKLAFEKIEPIAKLNE